VVGRAGRGAVRRDGDAAGSFAAYGNGGQFLLVIPALRRVIALLADPVRPGGTDPAPRRPLLARIVHHATAGAIPLGEPRPGLNPAIRPGRENR
jgi:hypothetical protein